MDGDPCHDTCSIEDLHVVDELGVEAVRCCFVVLGLHFDVDGFDGLGEAHHHHGNLYSLGCAIGGLEGHRCHPCCGTLAILHDEDDEDGAHYGGGCGRLLV